ncbi:hypothetical protein HZ326_25539 [Fusarium oxysporum f. sp. albedinis]|nr:hypothetical protein HZ326_25539 [Fusarium oxysporum f. sp. albedinis]
MASQYFISFSSMVVVKGISKSSFSCRILVLAKRLSITSNSSEICKSFSRNRHFKNPTQQAAGVGIQLG